ncbi:hypothetical protein Q2T40_06010 [Winogradskyella maritima]|uniref:Membrane or secreted protein n=1 Tax=Winogradskyella maritima TaxID=1517766 RepID=A0ABV8AMF5_9FLAO|nr:hypothetical protein [Winogradskyella maritima]
MKKVLFVSFLALAISFSVTSCRDQEKTETEKTIEEMEAAGAEVKVKRDGDETKIKMETEDKEVKIKTEDGETNIKTETDN